MPKCVQNLCSLCKFRVHNNHKTIFCNICHLWTHLKCTPLSLSEYNGLTHSHDEFVVSKETVVLRWWERSKQKFLVLLNELMKV